MGDVWNVNPSGCSICAHNDPTLPALHVSLFTVRFGDTILDTTCLTTKHSYCKDNAIRHSGYSYLSRTGQSDIRALLVTDRCRLHYFSEDLCIICQYGMGSGHSDLAVQMDNGCDYVACSPFKAFSCPCTRVFWQCIAVYTQGTVVWPYSNDIIDRLHEPGAKNT